MNTVALLCGIGLGAASGLVLNKARQEWRCMGQARRLKMAAIRDLKPGLVMTGGEVVGTGGIETPYTSTPAVWYRYQATERHKRRNNAGHEDQTLASGGQRALFSIRDRTGEIEVIPDGGEVVTYPHERVLKSKSGSRTPLKARIQQLRAADRANHPEGSKKPFFRKIEMDDAPLDVPDDLVELELGSSEAREALLKYYELWVQPGDRVCVMGTAVREGHGPPLKMKIVKDDKHSPLLVSSRPEDLTAGAFRSNAVSGLLVGAGLALVGIFLVLMGLGAVSVG
jgi:hypothetical protein